MDAPTLSLIVPLHNELPNLPRLLDACIAVLERTGESWEILLIDDGSDDGSWVFVQQVMAADERVRGLRHPQRLGKTLAYATGFRAARGRYLFTLDADLQEEPSAIHAMLQQLRHEADMVVGWRKVRRDAPLKVLASKVFNAVLRWGLRLPLHDANCGLQRHATRGGRRPATLPGARLPPLPPSHRASVGVSSGGGGGCAPPTRLRAFPLRAGALRSDAAGFVEGAATIAKARLIQGKL
jgi:glycosyltransferase involved in cell wall biosynthesis